MLSFLDGLRSFSFSTVVLRVFLAMLCGAAVGYGRTKKERSAGMRTYMLITIGAALSVLLALYQNEMLTNGAWSAVADEIGFKYDGSRLASQTITGIGFLGAGIIIKGAHQQVKGLTTATGLFATVCLGIAAGAGFYECVIIAVFMFVLVLNVMSPLEVEFKRRLRNITLSVEFGSIEDVPSIIQVIESLGAQLYDIDIEREEPSEDRGPSAIFIMQMSKEHNSHSGMLTSIAELDCVTSVQELIS